MLNTEWSRLLSRRLWRASKVVVVLLSLVVSVLVSSLGRWLVPSRLTHSVFSWLLKAHCGAFVRALGIQVVRDPYLSPDDAARPVLYLSNHISYLDILVLGAQWEMGFLAKSEVASWPVVGYVARACGTIFVKRDSLFSRAMCIEKLLARFESGRSMLVFPEGTTSIDGPRKRSRPFHRGALTAAKWAGADVKLVYMDYSDVEKVAWLGDDSLLPNLWMVLGRERTRVRVREQHHRAHARTTVSDRQMRMWIAESGFNTI